MNFLKKPIYFFKNILAQILKVIVVMEKLKKTCVRLSWEFQPAPQTKIYYES